MNRILYENRCKCNEEVSITKKRKSTTRSEGKPLQYPKTNEILSKTFQIKYEKKLSVTAQFILNSFQNKYLYYAMDDILYFFELEKSERTNLLSILYSPVLLLQNNYSINFFDIWIREIYIDEVSKVNKFLGNDSSTFPQFSYINLTLFYKTRMPVKKQDSLW
jgi:hypothetical protein